MQTRSVCEEMKKLRIKKRRKLNKLKNNIVIIDSNSKFRRRIMSNLYRNLLILILVLVLIPAVNLNAVDLADVQENLTSKGIGGDNATALTGYVTVKQGARLNVRTGVWGNIIGKLLPGARVTIVGSSGAWYKINYQGGVSYVFKQYVRVEGETSTPVVDNSSSDTGTTTTNTDSVATSDDKVINWLKQAGFSGENLRIAWAICKRETNGIPDIGPGHKNFNGHDYGLFQWNKSTCKKMDWWDEKKLMDPVYNAKVAYEMSKGGTNWLPWGLNSTATGMDARYYSMWSKERQTRCIWKPFQKWYAKYPGE